MGKNDVEQLESKGELSAIRRELEGKIKNLEDKLDPKIEKKVSNHVFYWIAGAILSAITGVLIYSVKVNDRADNANTRLSPPLKSVLHNFFWEGCSE